MLSKVGQSSIRQSFQIITVIRKKRLITLEKNHKQSEIRNLQVTKNYFNVYCVMRSFQLKIFQLFQNDRFHRGDYIVI